MSTASAHAAPLPEIRFDGRAVCIADLHLDVANAEACAPFVRWLERLDAPAALVVLGDLFDVWVGPAQARLAAAPLVLDALAARVRAGTRLVVVPGNRDFLLDRAFTERTGAELCPDGFVAELADGARMLCVHGDTFCTLDRGYQRLRRVLRARPVTWLAPRLPLWLGNALARRLRRASVQAIAAKLPEEKSVQRGAARAAAHAQHATLVVCGHAHAFRDEFFDDGVRWLVLDAFGGARDVLELDGRAVRVAASGA